MRPHHAYVFERFPSFTQTFCVREVAALERQGVRPLIFSIRDPRDEVPRNFPSELYDRVHFLPPEKQLVAWVKAEKEANRLPQYLVLTLRHWGNRPDKLRVYEAAYIGQKMREAGLHHAHSHFAGIGARVGWWLHHAFGFSYSFTGHANDIFCLENDLDVTLDHLMRDASLVITVSDFTANDLCRRFPAASRKIQRVYNGLDLARFARPVTNSQIQIAPTPTSQQHSTPLILSVGRLIEKKGYPDLIHACAQLKSRGIKFQCDIAGEGPLEAELRTLITSLDVADCITLRGAVSQDEIIHSLHSTTVFALACATEKDGGMDNLPTVLMEAMAAGVPCVSTRLAGVPEMVEHGVSGFLVAERDPHTLAEAMEKLLTDPALAARMGAAGHERAHRLFAQEITASHLLHYFAARSLMQVDWPLLAKHPSLIRARAQQIAWRLRRLARHGCRRPPQGPEFLSPLSS